jgi:hypothetical protein
VSSVDVCLNPNPDVSEVMSIRLEVFTFDAFDGASDCSLWYGVPVCALGDWEHLLSMLPNDVLIVERDPHVVQLRSGGRLGTFAVLNVKCLSNQYRYQAKPYSYVCKWSSPANQDVDG